MRGINKEKSEELYTHIVTIDLLLKKLGTVFNTNTFYIFKIFIMNEHRRFKYGFFNIFSICICNVSYKLFKNNYY